MQVVFDAESRKMSVNLDAVETIGLTEEDLLFFMRGYDNPSDDNGAYVVECESEAVAFREFSELHQALRDEDSVFVVCPTAGTPDRVLSNG